MTIRKRILWTVAMIAIAALIGSALPFRLHLPFPLPTFLALTGAVSFYLWLRHYYRKQS